MISFDHLFLPFLGHPSKAFISSIAFEIAVNTVDTNDNPMDIYNTRSPHNAFPNDVFGGLPSFGTRSPNPIVARATKQ